MGYSHALLKQKRRKKMEKKHIILCTCFLIGRIIGDFIGLLLPMPFTQKDIEHYALTLFFIIIYAGTWVYLIIKQRGDKK